MTGQLVEAQSSGPKVQGVEAKERLSRIPCASTQKADPVMLRIGLSDCLVDEDSASPEQSIAPDNRRASAGVNEKKKAPAGEAKNRREPDAAKQLKLRIVLANGVMIDGGRGSQVQAVHVSQCSGIGRPRDLRRLSVGVAKNGTPCFLGLCGARVRRCIRHQPAAGIPTAEYESV